MRKLVLYFFTIVLLLQVVGTAAFAEESEQFATLNVTYKANDLLFEGLEVSIYHVANIENDNSYALCGDFKDYPVDIKNVKSKDEWRDIATTISSYIVADGISATATATTDENGVADFTNLAKGLYLVYSVSGEKDGTVYVFESFFSVLPRPDENGNLQYDVKALPKHSTYVAEPEEIEYKVVKQWKDNGADKRPVSVEIEIFKDGQSVSVQTLSSDNNWSYTWKSADDGSKWTVVERNIANDYTVTVTENTTTFIVTNTYNTVTPPPQTGDVDVAWPYVLLLFAAGAILVIVSLSVKRT